MATLLTRNPQADQEGIRNNFRFKDTNIILARLQLNITISAVRGSESTIKLCASLRHIVEFCVHIGSAIYSLDQENYTINCNISTSYNSVDVNVVTVGGRLPRVYSIPGLQNTYFTFFEFATFFRFLSLDLRFFLKKRTVNRQTLNRS